MADEDGQCVASDHHVATSGLKSYFEAKASLAAAAVAWWFFFKGHTLTNELTPAYKIRGSQESPSIRLADSYINPLPWTLLRQRHNFWRKRSLVASAKVITMTRGSLNGKSESAPLLRSR